MDCERQEQLYNLDAHEEGSDAAEGGMDHTANPYTRGTDDFYAWRLGWKEVTDMLELDNL